MSLAQRTLSGFIWTLTSRIGTRISIFVVGIILARLLTPSDFGLIAMLGIFFAISTSLVDSGFTQALIREKEITEVHKSTAFFINLIISITIYAVLWFTSPLIARFFEQPQLIWLTRVMGLNLIFKALSIVQRAMLMQGLRFKLLSGIDVGVSILTGIFAIGLAYYGFGVWSLAIKYFLFSLLVTIAFWINNPWIPKSFINKKSFHHLFGFGSRLMATGLLNTLYNNVYKLVIGRYFSAATLGFYDRASHFTTQGVSGILTPLQQVTYPVLSKTQNDQSRLKKAFRKVILATTFVIFPLALLLGFMAEPLILFLLGDQWAEAIPFMQILCAGALITHLSSINLNLFKVVRRSDLYLKVSVINKIFMTIAIIVGLQFGIWGLIAGKIVSQYVEAIVCMFFTSRNIEYPVFNQFKDILPMAVLLIPTSFVLIGLNVLNIDSHLITLLLMGTLGGGVYFLIAWINNSEALDEIRKVILPRLKKQGPVIINS